MAGSVSASGIKRRQEDLARTRYFLQEFGFFARQDADSVNLVDRMDGFRVVISAEQ